MLGEPRRALHNMSVVHEVQPLLKRVTVKYFMDRVVALEDVKWYGENRVLLLAHGVVKAGMDLKRRSPGDVKIAGKTAGRCRRSPMRIWTTRRAGD